jgi:hypothetical protein
MRFLRQVFYFNCRITGTSKPSFTATATPIWM